MKSTSKIIIFVFAFLVLAASAYAADDSPLFEAVGKGDKAEVEALLAKGEDVNAKDKYGNTPLRDAAYWGKKEIAELLLAKGADVNAKNKGAWDGWTPLHWAADRGKKDIAELLLVKGADVNAKGKNGGTPLHAAVDRGEKDVAKLLLEKGADVNAKRENGRTPLHSAAYSGEKDIAELLLAKGADINAKDGRGKTPLDDSTVLVKGEKVTELLKAHVFEQAFQQASRNPQAALVQLTAQLKDNPDDTGARRLIVKLTSDLKPAPAIPEEARKHFVEGTAIVKAAKNPAQQALAAQSFTEALKMAPWWGDAYYNLGVAQELAEKYDEAEKAFNFYLLSNPNATEKREVQDRIYALSAKRKLLGAK